MHHCGSWCFLYSWEYVSEFLSNSSFPGVFVVRIVGVCVHLSISQHFSNDNAI